MPSESSQVGVGYELLARGVSGLGSAGLSRRVLAALAALTITAAIVAPLGACQKSEQQTGPGALPRSRTDVAPRLNASTYVAHGDLLERQGKLEQAAAQYRRALELTPNLTTARNRLGITLNKLGRHSEASAEFRAALEREPGSAYLYNNLGFSLFLEGKYEEAAGALARAVELQPTFRRARTNYGLVLARLGRDDEALREFSLAVSEAEAYYNLAAVQIESARYADAARSLERALALNPDFPEARRRLREVARLAATQEAESLSAADAHQAELSQTGQPTQMREARPKAAIAALRPALPDVAPAGEVRAAADVRTVDELLPPDSSAPGSVDPARRVQILAKIQALLAAAPAAGNSSSASTLENLYRLAAAFDDLVNAILTDAPRFQDRVRQINELLEHQAY